jgi:hypothetical protein
VGLKLAETAAISADLPRLRYAARTVIHSLSPAVPAGRAQEGTGGAAARKQLQRGAEST